jgi:hypothetical protein
MGREAWVVERQGLIASASGAGSRRRKGPPTILSGYWTNDSMYGTFDHHDAGRGDVRPDQGIVSRSMGSTWA